MTEKHCGGCDQDFPATNEFWHRARTNRDGLCTVCKACSREKARLWREQRRAEWGEEEFRRYQNLKVTRSRARTGNVAGSQYSRAEHRAFRRLKDRYPGVFERFLAEELAKERGES